ncbi:MAG TPA: hypothetical protein P5084_12105 [Paludibacter sp.]|nr:hypothetical protein [Paludibacter sp.]
MKLKEHLLRFYTKNNIPADGGINKKTFVVPFGFFKLVLPNFGWRKSKLLIHDLEHVVNYQDASWKGEIFIASWEIAVGYWRNFPLCIFPFWTMGFGLWKNPAAVHRGFYKGIKDRSITELKLSREELLEMELIQVQIFVENTGNTYSFWQKFTLFIFSVIVSQIVFLLPIILFISVGIYIYLNHSITF